MLLVSICEEKVPEERRVEQRLEDRIDVAGVADVVQAREVLGDLISLQGIRVFEMHFQSMETVVVD